jgi:hypothetical protein
MVDEYKCRQPQRCHCLTSITSAKKPNTGAYALAAISGFADVDAMSMSRLKIGELGADVAAPAWDA